MCRSVHCSTRQPAVHNLLYTPTESSAPSPSLETFFNFKPSSRQFLTLTLVNEAKVEGAVLIKKLKNYFVLVNQSAVEYFNTILFQVTDYVIGMIYVRYRLVYIILRALN